MKVASVKDLGTILRAKRLDLNESQEKFAARIGRPQSWLSDFERGAVGATLGTVFDIWETVGLSLFSDTPMHKHDAEPGLENDDMGDIATEFPDDEGGMRP